MPVKIEDRPIKGIREEVIDQLVMNYAHQEITLEAFENRLDLAMDTEDRSVLLEQVADLDLTTDIAPEPSVFALLTPLLIRSNEFSYSPFFAKNSAPSNALET